MDPTPEQVAARFFPHRALARCNRLSGGNVNRSWRLRWRDGGEAILQRLSPLVFPRPDRVMANLVLVLDHLCSRGWGRPGSPYRLPRLLAMTDGRAFWLDDQGGCWRLLTWLDQTRCLSALDRPARAEEVGRILGDFHLDLAGLDPDTLFDPLPGFHVTPEYLRIYDQVLADGGSRPLTHEERWCAHWIADHRHRAGLIEEQRLFLSRGVVHGDPKAGNVLFAGNRAVSLIDLDTAGPGLRLIDLADCVRSCCNVAGEESGADRPPRLNTEFFLALVRGYSKRAGHLLSRTDRELLVEAVWLICFELGLRFFTDHLAGDRYFQVERPAQNLRRARVQMELARSVDQYRDELDLFCWQGMMAGQNESRLR